MERNKLNYKILVIDDEKQIRDTYKKILITSKDGLSNVERLLNEEKEDSSSFPVLHVTTAAQGEEGYNFVKESLEQKQPYTVAFVDMRMPPGWDGLKTATALRQLDERIFIVIVTAFSDKSINELQTALKRNMLFLRKPFKTEEILQLARTLCIAWNRNEEVRLYQAHLEEIVEERTVEIRKKDELLNHSERLTSLGEIAAGVAHELNQPMAAINLEAENILWKQKSNKKITDESLSTTVNRILRQVNRAATIIKNMQTFAHSGNKELSSIHLHNVLQLVLEFYRKRLKKNGIELIEKIEKNINPVLADEQKFEQIVINFLSNAQYAVEEKANKLGKEYKKQITIRLREEENKTIFEVEDNGIGMTEEVRNKLFTPFFTTKPMGKGTGLGMKIVRTIIQEFEAKLLVESEENVGTKMRVIFDD